MRCFVIMPFDSPFDDVYVTIKQSVGSLNREKPIACMRLDESRPAGRITDRLLAALRASTFCIADLTGCKPNVMWETGYAMALGKPLIIVTQDLATLPFDVKDMQALPYSREQLTRTLGTPLRDIIRDTIIDSGDAPTAPNSNGEDQARLVIGLGIQLAELKDMIGQIVASWEREPTKTAISPFSRLRSLEGAWQNEENGSNAYIRIIGGTVVAPYCYSANNKLTAYYYDWRELDEYVFARFKWLSGSIRGFTFLKFAGDNLLQGAWWYDDDVDYVPEIPPLTSGNRITWVRMRRKPPTWAVAFFEQVTRGEAPDFIVNSRQQNASKRTRSKR